MSAARFLLAALLLTTAMAVSPRKALSSGRGRHYQQHDPVPTFVNKLAPASNPNEVFRYYDFPFCAPQGKAKADKLLTLGEVMESKRLVPALYDLRFQVDNKLVVLCNQKLSRADAAKLRKAIERNFIWEFLYDDLPIEGYVGREAKIPVPGKNTTRYYLYTHLAFSFKYNGDQVISADVVSDEFGTVDITEDKDYEIEFTYSSEWHESDISYADRLKKYVEHSTFSRDVEIQWFSIINSVVLVLLLATLTAIILVKILRKDFERYLQLDESDLDPEEARLEEREETGWKLLHGDVFRTPPLVSFLAASLGIGAQIFLSLLIVLFVSLWGTYYPGSNHGKMQTSFVVLYALTAGASGFVSGSVYKSLGGTKWSWNALLAMTLFFFPMFLVFCFLNSVAIAYGSMAALPAGTIVLFTFLWVFVTAPLTVAGAIVGKRTTEPFVPPCRVKSIAREIPVQPWFRHFLVQGAIAGFLPFSSVFIELFYIFDSVWGKKSYTLFGILFMTFLILLIVVSCLSITLAYFQLNAEDHEWWWKSFFLGGSPAFFILAYSAYYFTLKDMNGFMQVSWYIGYNLVVSYAFFLLLGSVGFVSVFVFIRVIFASVKTE